jgi:hypothetical protein
LYQLWLFDVHRQQQFSTQQNSAAFNFRDITGGTPLQKKFLTLREVTAPSLASLKK